MTWLHAAEPSGWMVRSYRDDVLRPVCRGLLALISPAMQQIAAEIAHRFFGSTVAQIARAFLVSEVVMEQYSPAPAARG